MIELLSKKRGGLDPLFIVAVCIPTLLAILYYGFFASSVYISESRFVVRSPDKPASPAGIGILLKSAGFSNAGDEIYAARDYVTSRDALAELNRDGTVARDYGSPSISIFDRFDPMGSSGSFEGLYKYFQHKVGVNYDNSSSITTLTVRAYSPRAAHDLNLRLLEQAETLVNRLNERGRNDLIRFAQVEVDEAQEKSRSAALALAAYRNRAGVVDPEKQAAVQLQMISKLQDELIATKARLLELRTYTPANPQVPVLRLRVKDLSDEIGNQLGMVAGDRKSLSAEAVEYTRRQLNTQFADKQLAVAMSALEDAQSEARRKQAYVERIVAPNLPDEALEPRRFRAVFATFAMGMVAWGVLALLLAGVREHKD